MAPVLSLTLYKLCYSLVKAFHELLGKVLRTSVAKRQSDEDEEYSQLGGQASRESSHLLSLCCRVRQLFVFLFFTKSTHMLVFVGTFATYGVEPKILPKTASQMLRSGDYPICTALLASVLFHFHLLA